MRWDLGIQGVGLLIAMSLGFGLIAQLVLWRLRNWWVWLIGAGAYFVAGVFVSEVWFGWATQEELQPNIDGLSFDEVLLLATLMALIGLLSARYLTRRSMRRARGGRARGEGKGLDAGVDGVSRPAGQVDPDVRDERGGRSTDRSG